MSLTDAGVCVEDGLTDVNPKVGTGLWVSGKVTVQGTTVVIDGLGAMMMLAVSGVLLRRLIDAAKELEASEDMIDVGVVVVPVLSSLLVPLIDAGGGLKDIELWSVFKETVGVATTKTVVNG